MINDLFALKIDQLAPLQMFCFRDSKTAVVGIYMMVSLCFELSAIVYRVYIEFILSIELIIMQFQNTLVINMSLLMGILCRRVLIIYKMPKVGLPFCKNFAYSDI